MGAHEQEYRWYLVGCARLGQTPLGEAEFEVRWQEYEDHAEKLRAAEAENTLLEIEVARRAEMTARMQSDPFVQAVLVGMSEDEFGVG